MDKAISLPFTHRNNLEDIKEGLETKPFTDKTSRFSIIISGKDRNELNQHIEIVKNILNCIKTETTSGTIETPIWN